MRRSSFAIWCFGARARHELLGPVAVQEHPIREDLQVQFRSEYFNAFNHPNWNMPGRDLGAGSFGVVNSAGDPRTIQFGLKLLY